MQWGDVTVFKAVQGGVSITAEAVFYTPMGLIKNTMLFSSVVQEVTYQPPIVN